MVLTTLNLNKNTGVYRLRSYGYLCTDQNTHAAYFLDLGRYTSHLNLAQIFIYPFGYDREFMLIIRKDFRLRAIGLSYKSVNDCHRKVHFIIMLTSIIINKSFNLLIGLIWLIRTKISYKLCYFKIYFNNEGMYIIPYHNFTTEVESLQQWFIYRQLTLLNAALYAISNGIP